MSVGGKNTQGKLCAATDYRRAAAASGIDALIRLLAQQAAEEDYANFLEGRTEKWHNKTKGKKEGQ